MMWKPTYVWIVFVTCLTIMTGVMAWISREALELERQELEASVQSENERLALWRMESTLVPLIAEESSRPHMAYSPFYATSNIFTKMLSPVDRDEVRVPSSLLVTDTPFVNLHFQCDSTGTFSSPQVPRSNLRDVAEQSLTSPARIERCEILLNELQTGVSREDLLQAVGDNELETQPPLDDQEVQTLVQQLEVGPSQVPSNPQAQQQRSINEYRQRSGVNFDNGSNSQMRANTLTYQNSGDALASIDPSNADVNVGPMSAFWSDEALMLARTATFSGESVVQGCLLDWTRLQEVLLEQVVDLLPDASLEPVTQIDTASDPLMLASIPVRLIPGKVAMPAPPAWTPMKITLGIAWAWLIVSAAAVFVLLIGVVRLSERRAAFVSAVTHELRTPLTTFRLYTDLMRNPDTISKEKSTRYVRTLRNEAERLSHLVENVLAYSRLEKSANPEPRSRLSLKSVLESLSSSLEERASQAGMECHLDRAGLDDQEPWILAEQSAIERIVLNLVDNSCKYAASGEPARIELTTETDTRTIRIRVRDFGPGISESQRRLLFAPFTKSATEAAKSAPGVGLGLSLSRRLARDMGGELTSESCDAGACFCLTLARSSAPEGNS